MASDTDSAVRGQWLNSDSVPNLVFLFSSALAVCTAEWSVWDLGSGLSLDSLNVVGMLLRVLSTQAQFPWELGVHSQLSMVSSPSSSLPETFLAAF